jgi:hypothetical protein
MVTGESDVTQTGSDNVLEVEMEMTPEHEAALKNTTSELALLPSHLFGHNVIVKPKPGSVEGIRAGFEVYFRCWFNPSYSFDFNELGDVRKLIFRVYNFSETDI